MLNCCLNISFGQQITFSKAIDAGGLDLGWSIIPINDGYVIGGGSGKDNPIYHQTIFIIKTDFNGNVVWQNYLDDSTRNYYPGFSGSLKKVKNGGYILGGSHNEIKTGRNFATIYKFDENGDTVFTRNFGTSSGFDAFRDAVETRDGGYAAFGQTYSYGIGNDNGQYNSNYYLVKVDSLGNFQWQKTYGAYGKDYGYSFDKTSDGGFILGGGTDSLFFQAKQEDGLLIKTDSLGNKIWHKLLGSAQSDYSLMVRLLVNGKYIVVQGVDSPLIDYQWVPNYYLTLTDTSGEVVWSKPISSYEHDIRSIRELTSGGFVITGTFMDTSEMSWLGSWIRKLDENGKTIWTRKYRYTESPLYPIHSYFYDVQPAMDGGFILSGFSFHNDQDIWLVKLDSMGCLIPGCDTIDAVIDISPQYLESKVYPNPFSEQATIAVTLGGKPVKKPVCTIYDMQGKLVQTSALTLHTNEKLEFTVKNNELATGAYFYKVVNSGEVLAWGKMIAE
ncbi:MAG TPA: T9SS type A sorting domain-containing protein [Flavobacterium sp.]|nr:T9SS type A sorting domain-containing protein [Flavobacterium sp.]